MKISDILRHKGSAVHTLAPSDTVATLVHDLTAHNVGAIVVCTEGRVAGIVSERDIVRRLAEHGDALLGKAVSDIMTVDVSTCTLHDSVDSVAETMTQRRFRHLPVIDDNADGKLVGIVSIGDVVSSRIRQLEHDRGQLEQYITG